MAWGLTAGLVAWTIFIATLTYAAFFVPDAPAQSGQLFTQRGGVQAGGFIAGWWIAIGGLASCVVGYYRELKGLKCLLGVVNIYRGSAVVDGQAVSGRRRPSVGYVPQLETIDWNFPVTVEEAVLMGRATSSGMWPWPRAQDRREQIGRAHV